MKLTRREIFIRHIKSLGYTRDPRSNHMTRNDLYVKDNSSTSFYVGPRGSVKRSTTGRQADAVSMTDRIEWALLEAQVVGMQQETQVVTPEQWAEVIINQIKETESRRTSCNWGEWSKLLKQERDLWITAGKELSPGQLEQVRTIINDWRKTL